MHRSDKINIPKNEEEVEICNTAKFFKDLANNPKSTDKLRMCGYCCIVIEAKNVKKHHMRCARRNYLIGNNKLPLLANVFK